MTLRILYLLPDHGIPFADSRAGGSIHARAIVDAMTRDAHEVTVVAMRKGRSRLGADGYVFHQASLGRTSRRFVSRVLTPLERRGGSPHFARAVFTLLRQFDLIKRARRITDAEADFSIIYARNAWLAFSVSVIKRRLGIPLVLEVNAIASHEKARRGEAAMGRLSRWIERKNLAAADLVVAVSDAVRSQAIEAGADPDRAIVLPNGVDLEHFAHKTRPTGSIADTSEPGPGPGNETPFQVGLVCSFRPFHGVDILIEAAARLREDVPNLLVRLFGEGPELERMKALAQARGLNGTVKFEGTIAHAALPAALADLNVAVAPYNGKQNEYGSPIKLYEYMAAGRPIVCSRWGEAARFGRDRATMLFHKAGDADDLAAKLLELYRDPALAAELARGGTEYVADKSWLANTRRIFGWLADRGHVAPGQIREAAPSAGKTSGEAGSESLTPARRRAIWADAERQFESFLAQPDGAAASGSDLPRRPPERRSLKFKGGGVARGRFQRGWHLARAVSFFELARIQERLAKRREAPGVRPLRVLRMATSACMGGVAKVMHQTAMALDPAEVETTILAFGPNDDVSPVLERLPGVRCKSKPLQLWFPAWDRSTFRDIRRLRDILRRVNPDLIHLHEPQFAPAVRIAAAPLGIPVIIQLHSVYSERRGNVHPMHVRLERRALAELPVVACAQNMVDDLRRYLRGMADDERQSVEIIPDGIDDKPIWAPEPRVREWIERRAAGRKKLLLIGRFLPLKRIEDFVAACRILMDAGEPIFAIVVSYGKRGDMLKMRADFEQTFLPGEAILLYHLASPRDLIEAADIGVSCSSLEGLPMVILEFARSALPIVCTDIEAHRQLVSDGETALLYPPGDLPALVRQLRRVLHDPELGEHLGTAAQASIKGRTWKRAALGCVRVYRRLFGGAGAKDSESKTDRSPHPAPPTPADAESLERPEYQYINPASVELVVNQSLLPAEVPTKLLDRFEAETLVLDGEWDQPSDLKFEESNLFISMQDHFTNGVPWTETPFFQRVVRQIEGGEVKWGCKTAEEFLERCKRDIDSLYETIQSEGYKTQRDLKRRSVSNEIRLAVDRRGRLMFLDGRHRLAIARLLGLQSVPVKIVLRHREWIDFQARILQYASASKAGVIYQAVDHPDLEYFPAYHGEERWPMIEAALGDYDSSGKRLVDIGAHWGAMCHRFEARGFQCTAIEKDASNVEFLEGIRDASCDRFDIWTGNIFDFPDIESFDVIAALNIFHHFLKTESRHKKFVKLLGRIRADLMFFEAHQHDPPGQMRGAFRNYAPDDFARFIVEHTGMSGFEELGKAADGRTLFKIWR